MSQLMRAKHRLLMKSSRIMEAEEEDFDRNEFIRSNTQQIFPQKQGRSKLKRQRTEHEIEQLRQFSPEFAKTDRRHLDLDNQDRFQILSEQNQGIFAQGRKSHRRGTVYSRIDPSSPDIIDMSFTEHQPSVYNESPTKMVKVTVHPEKLELIISKFPHRVAISPHKPKECQQQQIIKSTKKQMSKNEKFTDRMFPPKETIIFNRKEMYQEEGLKFERLAKIYDKNIIELVKFSEPTYLVPGKFSSSAVYCALAILCEDPSRVLTLFENQELNVSGVYYVYLCKDGVWRYVVVDDYLPVKSLLKRTLLHLHTVPKNGVYEIWPCLVEKALAKIYGTYQDLFLTEKRGVCDIMRCLTGLPVSEYSISKDFRAYLVVIDAAIRRKQIVVVQNILEEYHETAYLKSIDKDFSYQIIEVKKNCIVIRNLAEKQLTTKLTFEEAMIFTKLLIFRCEKNYVYISHKLRQKKGFYSLVRLELQKDVKCYWDIWQNNEAYYKKHIGSKVNYCVSPYTISIHRIKRQNGTEISWEEEEIITESGKQIGMFRGEYMLKVHVDQDIERDFTLSYYGQEMIQMQRVKNMEKWSQN